MSSRVPGARQPDPDRYDHQNAHCDLLVVGAGIAGMAAALAAAEAGPEPAVAATVDRGLIDEETAKLLEQLAPREREVVHLRHFEDLSLPEIALRLGLSVSSVKTHYYRGLTKLRTHLVPGADERRGREAT